MMIPQAEKWSGIIDELAVQRECLDALNSAWICEYQAGGGRIHCCRGCHECCTLGVNCTLTEAIVLARSLTDVQGAAVALYAERLRQASEALSDIKAYLRMQRTEMGMCPLLDSDGSCGVYAQRPLSCRSLLSTRESSWCGVDFSTLPSEAKREFVESLDRGVTAFPLHYVASAQETGREMETRQLTLMTGRFGFACYGSMPVLVYLVREQGLAEAANLRQAEQTVCNAGFSNPLLVSWLQ